MKVLAIVICISKFLYIYIDMYDLLNNKFLVRVDRKLAKYILQMGKFSTKRR